MQQTRKYKMPKLHKVGTASDKIMKYAQAVVQVEETFVVQVHYFTSSNHVMYLTLLHRFDSQNTSIWPKSWNL